MLAGMQLDLFTPLKNGPMTTEQLADALVAGPVKLKPLLYALAAAGLLTVEKESFFNSVEADLFLVQGRPNYMGDWHTNYTDHWETLLKTAESIRTGVPQARRDFSALSEEELKQFESRAHHRSMAVGRILFAKYDFSSYRRLLDVGGGTGGLAITAVEACPLL